MSGGALAFMVGAWAIILCACIVTLSSLVKKESQKGSGK